MDLGTLRHRAGLKEIAGRHGHTGSFPDACPLSPGSLSGKPEEEKKTGKTHALWTDSERNLVNF